MGIEEQLGEIVIAPRVLEKIIAIATAKVEGVHSFSNKSVSDTLSKLSLGRGVYLKEANDELTADIYLYLEYGVKVPRLLWLSRKLLRMLSVTWLMLKSLLSTFTLQVSFQIKHQNQN